MVQSGDRPHFLVENGKVHKIDTGLVPWLYTFPGPKLKEFKMHFQLKYFALYQIHSFSVIHFIYSEHAVGKCFYNGDHNKDD